MLSAWMVLILVDGVIEMMKELCLSIWEGSLSFSVWARMFQIPS